MRFKSAAADTIELNTNSFQLSAAFELWGDGTEAEEIDSTSELGSRVGDDYALGDIECLLTYRIAPPCASLDNEPSEDGAPTPSIIFSPE